MQEDQHADANANVDEARDLHPFASLALLEPLIFPHQFDGRFGAFTRRLGYPAKGIRLVEGLALLALAIDPVDHRNECERRHNRHNRN